LTDNPNPGSAGPAVTDKALALWEVISVIISCLIAEWALVPIAPGRGFLKAVPILLALGLMTFSHWYRVENLRAIGFRLDNFVAAGRILLLPTVGAVTLVLILGWLLSDEAGLVLRPLRPQLLLLPIWALVQQYALQGFINRRLQMSVGKGFKVTVLVGLLFALLHFPNPLLTSLTLLGGLIWAAVYQRHPNLLALAISHSLISLTLALVIPPDVINSLRVGFRYFN
jgi:membrane protease YdiL (CAAX protease family)